MRCTTQFCLYISGILMWSTPMFNIFTLIFCILHYLSIVWFFAVDDNVACVKLVILSYSGNFILNDYTRIKLLSKLDSARVQGRIHPLILRLSQRKIMLVACCEKIRVKKNHSKFLPLGRRLLFALNAFRLHWQIYSYLVEVIELLQSFSKTARTYDNVLTNVE